MRMRVRLFFSLRLFTSRIAVSPAGNAVVSLFHTHSAATIATDRRLGKETEGISRLNGCTPLRGSGLDLHVYTPAH